MQGLKQQIRDWRSFCSSGMELATHCGSSSIEAYAESLLGMSNSLPRCRQVEEDCERLGDSALAPTECARLTRVHLILELESVLVNVLMLESDDVLEIMILEFDSMKERVSWSF